MHSMTGEESVLSNHNIEMLYPFVCGSHAVKTPGSGLVDLRVHVASSHDTQSALISNVELELGAALATPKEHTLANTNVGRFMTGIRGHTSLEFGRECRDPVHLRKIIWVRNDAGVAREYQTLIV